MGGFVHYTSPAGEMEIFRSGTAMMLGTFALPGAVAPDVSVVFLVVKDRSLVAAGHCAALVRAHTFFRKTKKTCPTVRLKDDQKLKRFLIRD